MEGARVAGSPVEGGIAALERRLRHGAAVQPVEGRRRQAGRRRCSTACSRRWSRAAGRPTHSEARRLDLLPQSAPLPWDELMHQPPYQQALERLPSRAAGIGRREPRRRQRAIGSGLRLRSLQVVSNGSLNCDRSLRVSTSTSGPSSTDDRRLAFARHVDRRRLAGHRLLRGADLLGVGVDPLQAGRLGDRLQLRRSAARTARRPASAPGAIGLRRGTRTGRDSARRRRSHVGGSTWALVASFAAARHKLPAEQPRRLRPTTAAAACAAIDATPTRLATAHRPRRIDRGRPRSPAATVAPSDAGLRARHLLAALRRAPCRPPRARASASPGALRRPRSCRRLAACSASRASSRSRPPRPAAPASTLRSPRFSAASRHRASVSTKDCAGSAIVASPASRTASRSTLALGARAAAAFAAPFAAFAAPLGAAFADVRFAAVASRSPRVRSSRSPRRPRPSLALGAFARRDRRVRHDRRALHRALAPSRRGSLALATFTALAVRSPTACHHGRRGRRARSPPCAALRRRHGRDARCRQRRCRRGARRRRRGS